MRLSLAATALAALLALAAAASAQTITGSTPVLPGLTQCGKLATANMNSTADQAIAISLPSATGYSLDAIIVTNPSLSLTTAAGGVYSTTAKGGTAIVAATQVYSGLTSATANTAGNRLALTLVAGNATTLWTLSTIYLSLTTAQGVAATADVYAYCRANY